MVKAILAKDIMVAANMLTELKLLHKKEQKNYLMSNMLMFNHIQEVLQMLQSF